MKCKNCKTKNITKAHYCKNCGQAFTQQERDKAYNRTVFGIIANIRKLKAYATLSIITSKPWFKALTLVAILVYGLLQVKINGNEFKIQPSEYYEVLYNTTADEYYITSPYQQIGLNVYLPKESVNLTVTKMDLDNKVKNVTEYQQDDDIIITYDDNTKYSICADFVDNSSQDIIFYFLYE